MQLKIIHFRYKSAFNESVSFSNDDLSCVEVRQELRSVMMVVSFDHDIR